MAQPKKLLRIGVFQGKQRIEERLLRRRETVSFGQSDGNTFVILSSSMPKHHDLFLYHAKTDSYTLQILESMSGRVTLKKGTDIDLTKKSSGDLLKKKGDLYSIELNNSSIGRINIGKTSVLFQFVNPPDDVAAAVLASNSSSLLSLLSDTFSTLFLCSLLFSLLAHGIPLTYIMANDWPRNDDMISELPDWFLKREAVVIEEEPEKPDEPAVDPDAAGEEPQAEEPVAEVKAPPPQPVPQAPTTKAAKQEAGRKIVTQLLAIDGGDGDGYTTFANSLLKSDISGFDGISSADIGVAGNAAGGLGLGLDTTGGAGEAGLKGLEGAPGTGAVASSTTSVKVVKEKIEVKVSSESAIPASVQGNDKAALMKVFSSNKKHIETCYKRVVQSSGQKAGRVVAKITIGTDGKVQKVEITENQIGNNIDQCIIGTIKKWTFPKLPKMVTVMQRWILG